MIRITKQTDYGIVLMTHLAADPERLYNAPDLAMEAGLPLPMVSKILKLLTRDGLLVSHRGVKGGYTLSRPPAEITVDEIITSLEGPVAITECIEHSPGECEHERLCPTRGNWRLINQAVRQALERITLAEMTQPLPSEKLVKIGGGTQPDAALLELSTSAS